MINEISRNMPGVVSAQPGGESGSRVGQVQESASVKAYGSSQGFEAATSTTPAKPDAIGEKQLQKMVAGLNDYAQTVQRQLQFSIDRDNGDVVVKVVDRETQDVIREIPSEEIRNMQKHLGEISERILQGSEQPSILFQGEA